MLSENIPLPGILFSITADHLFYSIVISIIYIKIDVNITEIFKFLCIFRLKVVMKSQKIHEKLV